VFSSLASALEKSLSISGNSQQTSQKERKPTQSGSQREADKAQKCGTIGVIIIEEVLLEF